MPAPNGDVRGRWRAGLQQDLRYAIRRLAGEPRFAATAILILAAGIAACTVMFSVVEAVLLRPYSIDAPDRVVMIWPVQHDVLGEFTYNAARDLRRLHSLENVASVSSVNWGGALTIAGGEPVSVPCAVVSSTFFDVLRARPLLGRTFRPEDDQPSSPRVLILSHMLWTQHFGADPHIIGRRVLVREEAPAMPFEVVGVMPAEFFYPRGAQYWTPAAPRLASIARQSNVPMPQWLDTVGVFYGVGRLTAGATMETSRAETVVLLNRISQELKVDLAEMGIHTAMTRLPDHIFGPARRGLQMLTAAVTLVLLITCFNVAGLLLSRGASRTREMAVRAALGASRGVLMRQLLMESALLVLCGTVGGVAVAALSLQTLVALSPADIPRLDGAALDKRVLMLALFVAALTTLLVGLGPAAHVSRTSVLSDLKGSATGVTARGARAGAARVLIASQVAGTLMLLIAAGLCVQSFMRLASLDLGFDPANRLTFGLTGLNESRYPLPAQRADTVAQLLSRFERLPQVVAAGAVSQRPFEHGPVGTDSGFLLEGQPDTPQAWSRNPMLNWEAVTPHYFRAMGIRLLHGRSFDESDTENSPPAVIVSEAMATRVWPGEDPVGKRLRANASEGLSNAPRWHTVVGVVGTARYREIQTPRMDLYVPFRQTSDDVQHFIVRTATKPLALAPTIQSEITAVDKGLSMAGVTTMEQVVSRTRGPWRFNMLVFSAFGAVAVSLAAIGLFALVGYEVNQRTREIGVRMALGAAPGDIVRLMVAQGIGPATAGLGVGLLGAMGMTRLLSGLLFGVTPTDPTTFGEVLALLVTVMTLACYVPARRAASVDPQVVLRDG